MKTVLMGRLLRRNGRARIALLSLILVSLLAGCGDAPLLPEGTPSLTGGWLLADGEEVWGVDIGQMEFRTGGTLILDGYVLTDDGYQDREVEGSWEESGGVVTVQMEGEESVWDLLLDVDEAVFSEVDGNRAFRLIRPGPD